MQGFTKHNTHILVAETFCRASDDKNSNRTKPFYGKHNLFDSTKRLANVTLVRYLQER